MTNHVTYFCDRLTELAYYDWNCVTCLKFCQIDKLIDASTTSFLISYCMITYFRFILSLRWEYTASCVLSKIILYIFLHDEWQWKKYISSVLLAILENAFYGKEITTVMVLHSKLFWADKIFCRIFVILTSILLRHYFIQTPIPNTPIANFKSFNDVLHGDHDCLFYNQIRPINSGQFPEYEDATPR